MDRNLEDFWGYTATSLETAESFSEGSRSEKINQLLSLVKKNSPYVRRFEAVGDIRIFDINKTDETTFLRYHPFVKKVFTVYDLREALGSLSASVLLLPHTAVVDREALSEICEYYRCIKTIFYEYDS